MATVGWFGAYGVPIFFRLLQKEGEFVPGPFYLKRYFGAVGSKCIHAMALVYVLYTMVVFMLPTAYPITAENFNYSPIGVAISVGFFLMWWVVDAHRWFKGPKLLKQDDTVPDGAEGKYKIAQLFR
eukprot:TRINITY_DN59796_c0_g4_i1.p3 TRINITY_DN59796_c0_g4~~TRINITY_DN59796_c0_g4_i1.p3  ORF type:complete len:145 (-),score=12.45 TRINITY_DN59796_c0_g4_i1:80-457(-)